MLKRSLFALLALAIAAFSGGCTRHTEKDEPQVSLGREDAEYLIVIALDLSGSFADKMTRDGKGYEFTMRVNDNYFRNSIGTNNRIIIAQLSAANTRALLWDGTPVQMRQQFSTVADFHDFLLKKSHPGGSRLYDGIVDAFDYVLTDPSVAGGKTKCAMFVLSDFDDNQSGPKAEERLAQSLKDFAKTNGVVGFYFLDHFRVPTWRQHLREAGIKQWVCESEIVAYPPLPSFE